MSSKSLGQSVSAYLASCACAPDLARVLIASAQACVAISELVRRGALAGDLNASQGENVQGEAQKRLDVMANDLMIAAARGCKDVAGCASEELDHSIALNEGGGFLLVFDPLDGSSNIDVNAPMGTIVSVLPAPGGGPVGDADFLQAGRRQKAAAYALYGPQTIFALTFNGQSAFFTLDPETRTFLLTRDGSTVAPSTSEFAINMSNMRHWSSGVRRYIEECLAGKDGPRGRNFNMRWLAAMVGDMHRVLTRGGVFLYPWDAREPDRPGKLRLLYEAAPFALFMDAAGGGAVDGAGRILDVEPQGLHQRISVIMGAREEVDRILAYEAGR